MTKHILEVPYYSQHLDVSDPNWRPRSCGVLCLKMVIDFYNLSSGRDVPSIDELINEGLYIGGNVPAYGWAHAHLVLLARNHGFMAYPEEYRSHKVDYIDKKEEISEHEEVLTDKGIDKMVTSLKNNRPVIISIFKDFKIEDKFHMVVLTGFDGSENDLKGFYYNDPDSMDKEEGRGKFVPIDTFKKYWRKMAIYVNM